MMLGTVAVDLVMSGVVLALASLAVFAAGGAAVGVLTLYRARAGTRRRHSRLSRLAPGFDGAGIDEIDEALDRILAEERGASWPP